MSFWDHEKNRWFVGTAIFLFLGMVTWLWPMNSSSEITTIPPNGTSLEIISSNIQLRPLDILESGKRIEDVSRGTYFFAKSHDIGNIVTLKDNPFFELRVFNLRKDSNYFEVQKIDTKLLLIGFVNDESIVRAGTHIGGELISFTLFPTSSDKFGHFIAIPFDSIKEIDSRYPESGLSVLDVKTTQVILSGLNH